MKIILLKDVAKVGRKYDVKDVSDGFALNMLIPRSLAEPATPQGLKQLEMRKSKNEAEKKIQGDLLLKNLETIKGITVTMKGKANDKGHLFAGITKEILLAEVFKVHHLNLDPESVKLEKSLKETGEH